MQKNILPAVSSYCCSKRMDLKHCRYCNTLLPIDRFSPHPNTKDKLSAKCKACVSEYNRERWRKMSPSQKADRVERNRQLRQKNADAYRKANQCKAFRRKYGVTFAEYEAQWMRQGRCCAICNRSPEANECAFAVDHCHKTGKVRGILCPQCNVNLGRIEKYLSDPSRINQYLNFPPWQKV